ncbi:MAG: bifunctional DNA-formamidopyrimidine glycosylase/DNA-(apurinic or apyrimidinic site) lyase [Desulfobacterales bacterium]|jgi:formamidopyrimidine-DNA glycosylase|nr:bifunctional DNA-formamidopyrimidine glycosylase/DNA-(apurinic or apyrimidinic site) lyase [Desulfobacterales bacterium]
MPELPEVETVARDLNAAGLVGKTVSCAQVYWPRSIAIPSPPEFCRLMERRQIQAVGRRGKFLVFRLTGGQCMLLHLRMSGRLHYLQAGAARSAHEHVVLGFDDGSELRFHDTRKFGRIYLLERAENILGRLGPEPLEAGFTAGRFADMLASRSRCLKPLLLDQTFLAGLGNIYVDEALWEARLHPQRRSNSLSTAEANALHAAIRRVLRRGIRNLGTSLGTGKANFYSVSRRRGRNRDELKVFRRTGDPCPRCGSGIRRILVGQRSTHICGRCQAINIRGHGDTPFY